MNKFVSAGAVLALGLGISACTGSGYSNGSANPVGATAPSSDSDVVMITVVSINGAQSFSPSPATVPAGRRVVWHNVDTVTHRVVLDDRSVDTGELAPGAFSQPSQIGGAGGGQYHCAIHPVMTGSINEATQAPPPSCDGPYCY